MECVKVKYNFFKLMFIILSATVINITSKYGYNVTLLFKFGDEN